MGGLESYIGKVKGVHKITHVLPAPVHHTAQLDVGVAPGFEPLLNEQDLGIVVAAFGKNTAAACPGGYSPRWNSEPRACEDIAEFTEGVFHPFSLGSVGRVEGENTVAEASSFCEMMN